MDDKPTVAVDLDGTILKEVGYPEFGEPEPGVREALKALQELGYRVRVYTCRVNWKAAEKRILQRMYNDIVDYLNDQDIPYDDVVVLEEGKPFAEFYIDDKAIRYDNNWSEIVKFIAKQDFGNIVARIKACDRQMDQIGVVEKITRSAVSHGSR